MVNKPLDLTKPVQTRDGRPVRILCTDRKGSCPIVGLIMGDAGYEVTYVWRADGTHYWNPDRSLMNVPPPKHVMYMNFYEGGVVGTGYPTRDQADAAQASTFRRLACVRVEYTEGQLDD